jgi:hypothetical protein
MKKKKLNLGKLSLQKSKVASLESDSLTGGFQSWTGTAEPCFSDFGCGGQTNGCPVYTDGCPPQTNGCPTNGCPPATLLCNSHSVCPPGVYCY